MSNVHRLRTTDRIFYVTVNLRRSVQSFDAPEHRTMTEVVDDAVQGCPTNFDYVRLPKGYRR